MKWNEISIERQSEILQNAAARFLVDEDVPATEQDVIVSSVTNAELVAYALGRPLTQPESRLKLALRMNADLRRRFDRIMNRYAKSAVPFAAAASHGTISKRRDPDTGLEVEWVGSSAEPNSIFVKVLVPDSMRPASRLLLRKGEEIEVIPLEDDGEDDMIEVLISRDSDQYTLLSDPDSLLWVS